MDDSLLRSGEAVAPPLRDDITWGRWRMEAPRLFVQKAVFITLATYAFIPVMSWHDHGELGAYTYAGLLIGIHIAFLIIYFWRVRFMKLDYDRKSFYSRVLGLLFCVMLLGLVSESLDKDDLSMLAIQLVGLVVVHLLILLFLTVKVVDVTTELGTKKDDGTGVEKC